MVGSVISHYEILAKIGEGGMGVVYKARDTRLDRYVALKFLPPELTKDPAVKTRFILEAKAASALQHNNICTIHEIDETREGQMFICMDYYDGETLNRKIERGPLKIENIIKIAVQIAQGLAKAHEKGIVHRDIKAANVLMTDDDVVKILDFGLAKLQGYTKMTKIGSTVGTAPYISPEQAKGEEVDHPTDVWSLGVVLYEMVTGQLPFKGEYEQAILYQITNVTPEPITGLRSGVPIELERIVNKCLQKNPDSRYQTAGDLIVDLKNLQLAYSQIRPPTTKTTIVDQINRKWYLTVLAILIIGIALVLIFKPFSKEPDRNRKSIAVLTFKNLNDDKNDESFIDGLAEAIRAHLSKIADLKVISQQSALKYKNSTKSIQEIGKELGVATVLEGSCGRSGNRVRIIAQLIDAQDEGHIWAETYDKELTEIFAVQSEVAGRIAAALRVTLTPIEKANIQKPVAKNLTAYDYCLRGLEYYDRYTTDDWQKAIETYRKALEIDPTYAKAYAGMADCYEQLGNVDTALILCNKAIALDPDVPEAYKARANVYETKGWINKSIEECQKALQLDPNYAQAASNIGRRLRILGDRVRSYIWQKKAINLDPTKSSLYGNVGANLREIGSFILAESYVRKGLDLQPESGLQLQNLRWLYLFQKKYDKAAAITMKIVALNPSDSEAIYEDYLFKGDILRAGKYFRRFSHSKLPPDELPYIYWKLGMKNEARQIFSHLINVWRTRIEQGYEGSYPYHQLTRYSAVQEQKSDAYTWLQMAIDRGWDLYIYAEIDPLFENIRNDARFKQMIAKVKSRVDTQKHIIEEMEKNTDR